MLLGLAATLAGCATPAARAVGPTRDVRPTLAEIFGERPIDGERPSSVALSADGRWVSYRWMDGSPEEPEEPEPPGRRRGRGGDPLYVVSSSGGTLTRVGVVASPLWSTRGASLLFVDGSDLRVWRAGEPLAGARTVARIPSPGADLRLAPDERTLLVEHEGSYQTAPLDDVLAAAGMPEGGEARVAFRSLDRPDGWRVERSATSPAGILQVWGRVERPSGREPTAGAQEIGSSESSTSESRSSKTGSAATESEPPPASRVASDLPEPPTSTAPAPPASAPAPVEEVGPGRRLVQYAYDGTLARSRDLEIPAGFRIAQVETTSDGETVLLVLDESADPAERRGVLPDFLSRKVTTRPARGTNAWTAPSRQCIRIARWHRDDLETLDGFEEPARGRFSLEPSLDSKRPSLVLLAFTEEDRRGRAVLELDFAPTESESPASRVRTLLTIPGPVGRGEQLIGGIGVPLVVSEASGRSQALELEEDGALRAFTPEDVDVHWITRRHTGAAEANATCIALVSTPDAPAERRLWRTFRNGSPHAPLPMEGMWVSSVALSRDGTRLAFLGATLGSAEDVFAMPSDGSASPTRLTATAPAPEDQPGDAGPPRIVSFESLDGTRIWSFLYEPPAGVPRNGAAVVFLHGAGYLQQVRRSTGFAGYGPNHHFHRRLAAQGYVVLAPDFRGSAGYGFRFYRDVHQNLGIPDSDDILAAKRWLVGRGLADGDRIGLYGGSYGGFLTLMCLLRYPTEFACGAALRSVTDWRTYSPDYTRPLLGGGPDEVPHVYARCSPIDLAEALERPVLLLHGMRDDNVFAQDTIRLVERLQELGKTDLFELMLYPSQNHAFTAPHAWIDEYRRIERFLGRWLLSGATP